MTNEPTTPFKLNLPIELKDQLVEQAKRQHRSLTGEMIYRLQQSSDIDIENARETLRFINMLHGGTDKTLDPLLAELGKALGIKIE